MSLTTQGVMVGDSRQAGDQLRQSIHEILSLHFGYMEAGTLLYSIDEVVTEVVAAFFEIGTSSTHDRD